MSNTSAVKPKLQPLSHADLGGMLALNASAGWTLGREDWLTVLTAARFIGHKTADGQLVSCGALSPFGGDRGALGLVITHPDFQGQGLGRELVTRLVSLLPEKDGAICLISTSDGVNLYKSLGFNEVGRITRGFADKLDVGPLEVLLPEGWRIATSLPVKDLGNIIRLDAARYGAPRVKMVKRRLGQSDTRAFLYDSDDVLQGYALGSKQEGITVIGAVTAPNDDMALALFQSVADRSYPRYQVDIPCRHPDLIARLGAGGMDWTEDAPIMVRGDWDIVSGWEQYHALATQSFL